MKNLVIVMKKAAGTILLNHNASQIMQVVAHGILKMHIAIQKAAGVMKIVLHAMLNLLANGKIADGVMI
ncbi:MAG: hypothetical protein JRE23_17860 [Deltaproteobacteria bacterium]|nr:hypothetical protein [Deltaproteobacteria bacterium]